MFVAFLITSIKFISQNVSSCIFLSLDNIHYIKNYDREHLNIQQVGKFL